jgi:hypothetical protein
MTGWRFALTPEDHGLQFSYLDLESSNRSLLLGCKSPQGNVLGF